MTPAKRDAQQGRHAVRDAQHVLLRVHAAGRDRVDRSIRRRIDDRRRCRSSCSRRTSRRRPSSRTRRSSTPRTRSRARTAIGDLIPGASRQAQGDPLQVRRLRERRPHRAARARRRDAAADAGRDGRDADRRRRRQATRCRPSIDNGIKKIDDNNYEIDKSLVDKVLANPMAVAKGARVVPAVKNGKPDGFKLYAIRPSSVYSKLGLANGDTLQSINGFELTSADKALEVYTKLREATSLEVEVTRRGKPVHAQVLDPVNRQCNEHYIASSSLARRVARRRRRRSPRVRAADAAGADTGTTRRRARRGRRALQLQEAHGPGRGHVQARDRAQGSDHVGDGLHLQELHPRSAHRVDRQEGHGDRAEQDEPAEAYRVFLVALSTMGLTVVPKGNMLRIVESATAKSETVPIYKKGMPADEDQMVRYVLRPSYAQVETLRAALDSIRSPAGNVQVAGIDADHHRLREPGARHDVARQGDRRPGRQRGHLHDPGAARRRDAARRRSSTRSSASPRGAGARRRRRRRRGRARAAARPPVARHGRRSDDVAGAVPSKILVDDRTNTLIVVSSEAGYLRVKALVERLDISLDTEGGSAIHVYPLENALAEELATTLNNALSQGAQQSPAAGAQPAVARRGRRTGRRRRRRRGGELGAALEGQVRVIGDKPTNSLIVMSSGRDFLAIKDVIRRLDQPRRQVFIEALILEVQLNKELDIGTSSHGGLPVDDGDALVLGGVQTLDAASRSTVDVARVADRPDRRPRRLAAARTRRRSSARASRRTRVLFQALATQDNTNILSAPHIIAIDNEKAEFSVGNNIPYKAGLSFGGFGLPTGGRPARPRRLGSIGQNIQREKLNLDAQRHAAHLEQRRGAARDRAGDQGHRRQGPELGPTWTERKLKTQVVVHDQQSVVIGGLIQERDVYNVTKVPLLGDIPLLGYLFKYTTKTKKKTNLLILLTPYIIKDQLDLAGRSASARCASTSEFAASFANLNDDEVRAEDRLPPQARPGRGDQPRGRSRVEEDVGAAQRRGQAPARRSRARSSTARRASTRPTTSHGDGRRRRADRDARPRRDRRPAEDAAAGADAGAPREASWRRRRAGPSVSRRRSRAAARRDPRRAAAASRPRRSSARSAKQREEGGLLGEVLRAAEADRRGSARARARAAVRDAVPARPAARRGHPGRADRQAADQLRAPAPRAAARPRRDGPRRWSRSPIRTRST